MKSTTSDSQEDEYANASSIQQESGTFEPSELVLGTSNQLKLTAFDSKNMGYITTPFMKEPTNIIKIELFINHEISVKSHHLSWNDCHIIIVLYWIYLSEILIDKYTSC